MAEPTLSVVLCAYDEAAHLPAQLWALTHQDRPADQLVLLDDGSTDGTGALLAATAAASSRAVYETAFAPHGAVGAYNAAVAWATGDWLFLASANDVVQPGAFAAWAAAVALWPDAVLIVGETTEGPLAWSPTATFLPPAAVHARLQAGGQIHGAGVFLRRAAWDAAGGYDPALEWLADWWLYHALALSVGCAYLPRRVAALRVLPGQYSHGYQDAGRMARVAGRLATLLRAPARADLRAGFITTPLLTYGHVGSGAVLAALLLPPASLRNVP